MIEYKKKNSFGFSFFSTNDRPSLQSKKGYRPPLMSIVELSEEIGILYNRIYRRIKKVPIKVYSNSSYSHKVYYNKDELMSWATKEFKLENKDK